MNSWLTQMIPVPVTELSIANMEDWLARDASRPKARLNQAAFRNRSARLLPVARALEAWGGVVWLRAYRRLFSFRTRSPSAQCGQSLLTSTARR